jgi:hypothetical protein
LRRAWHLSVFSAVSSIVSAGRWLSSRLGMDDHCWAEEERHGYYE